MPLMDCWNLDGIEKVLKITLMISQYPWSFVEKHTDIQSCKVNIKRLNQLM